MTQPELQNLIATGQRSAFLTIIPDKRYAPQMTVPVLIKDFRKKFDRLEAQVKPTGGFGCLWVTIDRLTLIGGK